MDSQRRAAAAAQRKHTLIEQKESQRWSDTLRQAHEEERLTPNPCYKCVADSKADIYELLVEAHAEPRDVE